MSGETNKTKAAEPELDEQDRFVGTDLDRETELDGDSFDTDEDAALKGADEAYDEIEKESATPSDDNTSQASGELVFSNPFADTSAVAKQPESGGFPLLDKPPVVAEPVGQAADKKAEEQKPQPDGFPLLGGDKPKPEVVKPAEVEPAKDVAKEAEEKFKTRDLSPEELKVHRLQGLLAVRLQAIGLRGGENLQQVMADLSKEMGTIDDTGRLKVKEGENFKVPEYGDATKKALKLYTEWLKEHGIPGSLQQLTAEALPIPPNPLVRLPMDPERNRPVSVSTFIRQSYQKDVKPLLDIPEGTKPGEASFDVMLEHLNEADNFIIDSAQLMRKASIEFADQKMVEMVKRGSWPKEWLEQRERTIDKEAWVGAVSQTIDLSMRTGRTIEALHYLRQKPNGAELLPNAIEEAKEFADIKYSADGKKITSVKFKLPKELKLADPDDAEVLEKMNRWLKKYGGEVASTLERVEMAAKDPRYHIYWGDIEVPDGRVQFDGNGVVKDVGIGEAAVGKHFNLISCRFGIKEGRDGNTGDLQKITLDYTLQYGDVPIFAYLNCYMDNVGDPQTPNGGKGLEYEPDDWVAIRTNSGTTELVQAKDLQDWKTMQQIKHYGSKAITATMDIAMLASGGGTALSALRQIATTAGKKLLAKGLFEVAVGGLGIINNAGAREYEGLHTLETYRGYYFLGHIGYSSILRPGGRLLAGLSGPTKFETFAQTAIRDSNLVTRGLAKGGQYGFKAIEWPFNAMLVHDMIEQGKILRNADTVDFAGDALASTDQNIRDRLLAGEKPETLKIDEGKRDYKSMSLEFLSEYAESLGIKDIFKGADISKLDGKQAEIAKLLREAEQMFDKPHAERLKFIQEKLIPLFQPSGDQIHDAELKRANGPIGWKQLEDKRVIVSDTAVQEKEYKEAKDSYESFKKQLEDDLRKAEEGGPKLEGEELKKRLDTLRERESEMKDKEFRLNRAIDKKDGAALSVKEGAEGADTPEKRQVRKAAAMLALLLGANNDGSMPADGILTSRDVNVAGWSVEKVQSHDSEGQPIYTTVSLKDRTLTQQIKASDLVQLLREDLKDETSVERRMAVGEFLTRSGGISGEQYAATLVGVIEDKQSSTGQKQDAIARLGTVMISLRGHERQRAGSLSRVDLQKAKGEAIGFSSLDIQTYLHKLSRDTGSEKDVRAFASYINYMSERNPKLISADDTATLLSRVHGEKLGVTYDTFIKEMKAAAFEKEPKTQEQLDEKYHAIVALESFADDKTIGVSREELLKELAACVNPLNPHVSALALHRLMQPIEGAETDLTRLAMIDRMDLKSLETAGNDFQPLGGKIRQSALLVLQGPTLTRDHAIDKATIVSMLHPLNMGESARTLGKERHEKLMDALRPYREQSVEMAQVLLMSKTSGEARALSPALRALNTAAFDKYPELRVAAAHVLGAFGDDSADTVRLLTAAADIDKESNGHVRLEAFHSLMAIQSFAQLNDLAVSLLGRETNPMMAAELEQFARFFERGWNPESYIYQSFEEESRNKEALKELVPDPAKSRFPDWILPATLNDDMKTAKFGVFQRNEPTWYEYIPMAPGGEYWVRLEKWNKEKAAITKVYDDYNKRFDDVVKRAEEQKSRADQDLLALVLLRSRPLNDNFNELKETGISPHAIAVHESLFKGQQEKAAKVFTNLLKKGSGEDRVRAAAIVMEAIKSPDCCAEARLILIDGLLNNTDRSFNIDVPLNKSIDKLTSKEKADLELGRISARDEGGTTKLYASINVGAAGTQALLDMMDQPFFKVDRAHRLNYDIYLKAIEFMRKCGDTEMLAHRKVELFPRLEGKAKSEHIDNPRCNHAARQLVADKRDRVTPIFEATKPNVDETTADSRVRHLELALAWSGRGAQKGSDEIEFAARSAVERIFRACKDLPFEGPDDARLASLRKLTERATEKSGARDDRVRLAAAWMLKDSPLKEDRDLAATVVAELAVGGGVDQNGRNPSLQHVRYGVRYDARRMLKELAPEQKPAAEKKLNELIGGLSAFNSSSAELNRQRDIKLAACHGKLGGLLMDQGKTAEAKPKLEKAMSLYFGQQSYDIETDPFKITRTKVDSQQLCATEHIFDVADVFSESAKYLSANGKNENAHQFRRLEANFIQGQLDYFRVDIAENLFQVAESRAKVKDDYMLSESIRIFGRAQKDYEIYEGKGGPNSARCFERCGDLSIERGGLEKPFYPASRFLDSAEYYYGQALEIRQSRRAQEPIAFAEAHVKLGELALLRIERKTTTDQSKDIKAFQDHFEEAIRTAIESGRPELAAKWRADMARAYVKLEKTDLAQSSVKLSRDQLAKSDSSSSTTDTRLKLAKVLTDLGKPIESVELMNEAISAMENDPTTPSVKLARAYVTVVDTLIPHGNTSGDTSSYAKAAEPLRKLIDLKLESQNGEVSEQNKKEVDQYIRLATNDLRNQLSKGNFEGASARVSEMLFYDRLAKGTGELSTNMKQALSISSQSSFDSLKKLYDSQDLGKGLEPLKLYIETQKCLNKGTLSDQARGNITQMMTRIDEKLFSSDNLPLSEKIALNRVRALLAREYVEHGPPKTAEGGFESTPQDRMSELVNTTVQLSDDLIASGKLAEARQSLTSAIEFQKRLLPDAPVSALTMHSLLKTYPGETHAAELRAESARYVEALLSKSQDNQFIALELTQLLQGRGFGSVDSGLSEKSLEIIDAQVVETLLGHADKLTPDKRAEFLSSVGPRLADAIAVHAQKYVPGGSKPAEPVFGSRDSRPKTLDVVLRDLSAKLEEPLKSASNNKDVEQFGLNNPQQDLLFALSRQGKHTQVMDLARARMKSEKESGDLAQGTAVNSATMALSASGRWEDSLKLIDEFSEMLTGSKDRAAASVRAYSDLASQLELAKQTANTGQKQQIAGLERKVAEKMMPLLEDKTKTSEKYVDGYDVERLVGAYGMFGKPEQAMVLANTLTERLKDENSIYDVMYGLESLCRAMGKNPSMQGSIPDVMTKMAEYRSTIKDEDARRRFSDQLSSMIVEAQTVIEASEKKDPEAIAKLKALKETLMEKSSK